jgi:lysine-specific histone demethylase 1
MAPRIKTEPALARSGPKRKYGYVDVWEPISKPDPLAISAIREKENVDYEARLFESIRAEIGDRPIKPAKGTLNPFILFTKDAWPACKAELDLAANAAKPGARASRTEIRSTLGLKWRNAAPEIKQPYVDRCKEGREDKAEARADYDARAEIWEQGAARLREEYLRLNKPPELYELPPSGRKGRKST